jgi:hypothetical protein
VAKHMPSVIVAPFVRLLGILKLKDWANEQNLGILSTHGCMTFRRCVKEPIQIQHSPTRLSPSPKTSSKF